MCLLCAVFMVACHDSSGNRVSMAHWWQARFHPDKTTDTSEPPASASTVDRLDKVSAAAPASDRATAATADGRERPSEITGPTVFISRDAQPPPAEPSPHAVRANILPINGDIITVDDVLDPIRTTLQRDARQSLPSAYFQRRNELVRRTLVDAVTERLIWHEARALINEAIEPQLEKFVDKMEKERINREFGGRETRYEKFLTAHGKTRADVREMLRRKGVVQQYLRDKLLPMIAEPSKRELRRDYESHHADFDTEPRREMFLIDIPFAAFLDPQDVATPEAIDAARGQARIAITAAHAELAQRTPFEEVARKYSRGRMRNNGGAYGFISARTSPLVKRYDPAWKRLCQLDAGAFSEPFEAARAFFIVKVGRIQGGASTSFQDAQPQIAERLRERRFARLRTEFLQKRLDHAHIGSLDDFFHQVLEAAPKPSMARTEAP